MDNLENVIACLLTIALTSLECGGDGEEDSAVWSDRTVWCFKLFYAVANAYRGRGLRPRRICSTYLCKEDDVSAIDADSIDKYRSSHRTVGATDVRMHGMHVCTAQSPRPFSFWSSNKHALS